MLRLNISVGVLCPFMLGAAAVNDWPMLGHDAERSGSTPAAVRPPFDRKWYRLFTDEGLMSGIQPVVAEGKVLLGTLHGVLHAIDAETGQDVWSFKAGGAILHTCGVTDGQVFFDLRMAVFTPSGSPMESWPGKFKPARRSGIRQPSTTLVS